MVIEKLCLINHLRGTTVSTAIQKKIALKWLNLEKKRKEKHGRKKKKCKRKRQVKVNITPKDK